MNREKVINCLTDIEQIMVCRQEICPREELQYWIELQEGVADAIALLKDQDPIKPITASDEMGCVWYYVCPNCKISVGYKDKFCRNCGKQMDWR